MNVQANASFHEDLTANNSYADKVIFGARRILDDEAGVWSKPVVEMPLAQAFPQLGEVREFRSRKCIFNHDMSKLFNVVSQKYAVISHAQVIDAVESAIKSIAGESECKLHVASVAGGARMRATVDLPWVPESEIKVGDIVKWRLSVLNSYDYVWPFELRLESFRLICKNGAMSGKSFGSISGKHFSHLLEGGLDERVKHIISTADDFAKKYIEMADKTVDARVAEKVLRPRFPKKLCDQLLVPEKFPQTAWDLYNSLTAFSTHSTKTLNRRTDTDLVIADLFFDRPKVWAKAYDEVVAEVDEDLEMVQAAS